MSMKKQDFFAFSLFLLLYWTWTTAVQAQCNGNDITTGDGYRVRSLKVETLFGRTPRKLEEMLSRHRGEEYVTDLPDLVVHSTGQPRLVSSRDAYRREVREFFRQYEEGIIDSAAIPLFTLLQRNSIYFRVTYVDDCVQIVPAATCESTITDRAGRAVSGCVDVTIRIKVLPINTSSLSASFWDFARSNGLTFHGALLRPVLAFNPTLGIEHDRAYGLALAGSVSTNLLSLPDVFRGKTVPVQQTQLGFSFDGSRSLTRRFYNTLTGISLSRVRPFKSVESFGLHTSYAANRQPQGEWTLLTDALHVGGNTLLKFKKQSLSAFNAGAGYRRASNRVITEPGISSRIVENAFESYGVLDGRMGGGFTRGAVWYDAASVPENSLSYQRIASAIGYSKDLFLPQRKCRVVQRDGRDTCIYPAKNPSAIGVELLTGAGHAWGSVPTYALFYGGNQQSNFLHGAIAGSATTQVPGGPLIRSFGRNSAGAGQNSGLGGTTYWNVSASVSLPIPALSRPLLPAVLALVIPPDAGALSCEDCSSLKDMLKNQVDGGKNMLIIALANQKMDSVLKKDLALTEDSLNPLTANEKQRLAHAESVFEKYLKEAQAEADKIIDPLKPAIHHIADRMNLFSIKPLVLFDAASIFTGAEPGPRTRMAVGAGLQFNVVVARLEAAYMQTVRYLPGDDRRNVVLRMVFEKIF
jgi:hypothetical protein